MKNLKQLLRKKKSMKEDMKMIKSSNGLGKNIKIVKEEVFQISAETFAENYVYNIIEEGKKLWLSNKDIAEKLGVPNVYNLIDEQIKGKCDTNNPKKQQIRKYKDMDLN